jgi:hypothetical protein
LSRKDLYDKGWRGQFPPLNFTKLNSEVHKEEVPEKKFSDLVGTKLKHISPIDKMTKNEFLAPVINEEKCL